MEKYKLKPIEHKQVSHQPSKKIESRPITAGSVITYPPDIRLKILQNMCKSGISNDLYEGVIFLTKWVKAQKSLTLKPSFLKYFLEILTFIKERYENG